MPSRVHSQCDRRSAFTLIELVLVLALLAMAVAVAAPSLSRFFRGRTLDNEARRLLALTRYAQSRAVSEGVPMLVWFKPEAGEYGLLSETTFTDTDPRAVTHTLDDELKLESDTPGNGEAQWKKTARNTGARQMIRFTPEGYAAEDSPEWVALKTADEREATWLVLSTNRMNYELGNRQPEPVR